MLDIIKSEDVLQSIPVRWIGYTPPGGEGWRKLYTEKIAPIIAENRIKAETTKKAIEERERIVAMVRSLATEIASKGAELSSVLSSIEDDNGAALDLATRASGIQAGARGILEGAGSLSLLTEDFPDTSDINEDIRFFDAFANYIDEDVELDKVLYALFTVDLKYRVKLLRAACRMLTVVEEAREILRHSNSKVFKALKPRLDTVIDALDKSYALVGPGIRKFKKEYAKLGAEALASIDYTFMKGKEG